jgi:hypothetical protein
MTLQGKWMTCSKIKEAHSLGHLLSFFIPTKLKVFDDVLYILILHVRIRLMIALHDSGFLGISCEPEIFSEGSQAVVF